MRPRSPSTAVLACLLLAGCGLRVDPQTRQDLLQQTLHGEGRQTGPVASGPDVPGVATGPTSRPSAGASAVPGQQVQGPVTGPSALATLPPGGNGGATDVGVTATSITVGTIADLSGPQPGLFDGVVAGARAYFAYVNSQGGVYGRTLTTKVADSQLACNATTKAYEALVPSVFALVSGMSLFDNCGAAVLKDNPKVPDVSFALTPEHSNHPSTYQVQPSVPGWRTGPPKAFVAAFPEIKDAIGGLYPDVAGARVQWQAYKATVESLGYTVAYEAAVSPTQVDYTQYVIAMRQSGVKMPVLLNTAANNAKFINAAIQQGYNPPVIDSPGTLYDPSLPEAVGKTPTNLYNEMGTALFNNPDERSIPGVKRFQDWMAKTAPEQVVDQFSVYGWSYAGLFVQALRDAGPRVTRAGLLAALKDIHSFTAEGLIISGDPGARKPQTCYLLAHYVNGVWERWKTPATGARCDAPYHFTG